MSTVDLLPHASHALCLTHIYTLPIPLCVRTTRAPRAAPPTWLTLPITTIAVRPTFVRPFGRPRLLVQPALPVEQTRCVALPSCVVVTDNATCRGQFTKRGHAWYFHSRLHRAYAAPRHLTRHHAPRISVTFFCHRSWFSGPFICWYMLSVFMSRSFLQSFL